MALVLAMYFVRLELAIGYRKALSGGTGVFSMSLIFRGRSHVAPLGPLCDILVFRIKNTLDSSIKCACLILYMCAKI
jgi:hypothetical protein